MPHVAHPAFLVLGSYATYVLADHGVDPLLAGLLLIFCINFFRDPERPVPAGDDVVVAAADGTVADIVEMEEGEVLKTRCRRVGIFLSVFDVHVNRAPIAALVQDVTHRPGRFMAAWGEEASQENEQTLIRFATPDGDVWVKLIAGLIARRIVCRVRPGGKVAAGDRIGLIRFGSRVDCILPEAVAARLGAKWVLVAGLAKPLDGLFHALQIDRFDRFQQLGSVIQAIAHKSFPRRASASATRQR